MTNAPLTLLATSTGVLWGVAGAAVAMALAGGTIGLLVMLRPLIRRTTLIGPWWWTFAAIVGLGLVEVTSQLQPLGQVASWLADARLAAAALSLCPVVSVLGAKRPQDRAWSFVVLVMWGIVSLPSIKSLRGVILWVLVALPAINYLPTRHAWSAALVVLGEVLLLAPYLPLLGRPILSTDSGLVSLACFLAAAFVAMRTTTSSSQKAVRSFDQLWHSFRDLFGLFWALRVQERVNSAARQSGWSFYLSWSGFRSADDDAPLEAIPVEHARTLKQTLRGLLRRFAAAEWIATQLPEGVD